MTNAVSVPSFFTVSRNFIFFPLPRTNSGAFFKKKLGAGTLIMTSATKEVPYGLYARLALTALTNIVNKMNDKTRYEEFSIYELLKELRYQRPTGKQLNSFESQLMNWCSTLISLQSSTPGEISYNNLLLVDSATLRLAKNISPQHKNYIRFTEKGKEFLKDKSVPIPSEAIRTITNPMDFDVLSWLIYSVYLVSRRKSDSILFEWKYFYPQFGIDNTNKPYFRKEFCKKLYSVQQAFYPQARIEQVSTGIKVNHSPLRIPNKTDTYYPQLY